MPIPKNGWVLVVAALLIFAFASFGISSAADRDQMGKKISNPPENAVADTKTDGFQKWALFPVIAGSKETGLMLGGLAVRFFEPASEDVRTNTLDLILFGTTNEQFKAIVTPNFYFDEGLYHLKVSLAGELWPANYYGIGNDSDDEDKEEYDAGAVIADMELRRRVGNNFYVGVGYTCKYETIDTESGGMLESNEVTGWDGGYQSGPGLITTYDSRDNPNDARSGSLINFRTNWYQEPLGSDYRFEKYALELGRFFTITETTGLALGAKLNAVRGDVPFRELSSPDGGRVLRGIENGRYRDRDMAALQIEYRFPITGRWGGVAFAETAQVAHDMSELVADGWKYSIGGGLRYALNPSERFNFRVDLSFVDGGGGFFMDIREAF